MNKTEIEQLEYSWNPIAMRCAPISEGCANCWHLRMANRLAGNSQFSDEVRAAYAGEGPPVLVESRLDDPLKRKKPTVIGIQWMGDLFHEDVPDEYLHDVWHVMVSQPKHTFLVLTKRPERMQYWIRLHRGSFGAGNVEPPSNVWLGVTIENQECADERIPILLQTPAAMRFVSCEPLLGPVGFLMTWFSEKRLADCFSEYPELARFDRHRHRGIDWVICGGESGPGARPMHPNWARSIRDQCQAAGVPFFFKQGSAANWENYKNFDFFPADLQIRQFP